MPPKKRVKAAVRKSTPKSKTAAAAAAAAEEPSVAVPVETLATTSAAQPEAPALESSVPSFSETPVSEITASEATPSPLVHSPVTAPDFTSQPPSGTPLASHASDAGPAMASETESDASPAVQTKAVAQGTPAIEEPFQATSAKTTTTRMRKVIKKKIIKKRVPKAASLAAKQEEKVLEEAAVTTAAEVADLHLAEAVALEEQNHAPIFQQDPEKRSLDAAFVFDDTVQPEAMETDNVGSKEKKVVLKKKVIKKKIVKKRIPKAPSLVAKLEERVVEKVAVATAAAAVVDTKPEAVALEEQNPASMSQQDTENPSLGAAFGSDETIKTEAIGTKNVGLGGKKIVIKKKIIKKRIPKVASLAAKEDKVVENTAVAAAEVVDMKPAEPAALEQQNAARISQHNPEDGSLHAVVGSAETVQSEPMETDNVGFEKKDVPFEQDKVEGEVPTELVIAGDEEAKMSERQKRRKTEIFIGGLDRDAKEEDLKRVFAKVGEIVEIRMMMDGQTGKNKGYAFLRYKEPAEAKKAISEFSKVEICGKLCGAAALEGNDTIFLGNIEKKWKKEDVIKLLQDIGIEKIDTVTVMVDPNNAEVNRGFAFLELESNRDAQIAYKKLQKKEAFGKGRNITVAWAEPRNDPDEEEMQKVKSVYAEGIPSSWDEAKVSQVFKKFGDIERVVLARNMASARRKDFAFVNFTTREATLSCIESFDKEEFTDNGSKLNVKVSLAKPLRKGKQSNGASKSTATEKDKPKKARRETKASISLDKGKSFKGGPNFGGGDNRPSMNGDHLHILREQAAWRHGQIGYTRGPGVPDYPYAAPGGKRAFSSLGEDTAYSDSRGYPRSRLDSSFPSASSSYSAYGMQGGSSLPYYQRPYVGYPSSSLYSLSERYDPLQRQGFPPYGSSARPRY